MSKYTLLAKTLNGDSVEFDLSELMPAKYGDDDVFYVNDMAYVFSSIKCVEHDEMREQLAAAQMRIAELTKSLDGKNDVIEGWRSECAEHADARATAEKRIAELTKTTDAKNRLIDHWRFKYISLSDERETAEKRVAELEVRIQNVIAACNKAESFCEREEARIEKARSRIQHATNGIGSMPVLISMVRAALAGESPA